MTYWHTAARLLRERLHEAEQAESELSTEVMEEGKMHRHYKQLADDAMEALAESRAEIARLQSMVTSFVDGFAVAAESLHAANKAMRDAAPPDLSEQFGRDMVRHINIMGAHGDPDYLRGDMSCRHVDMRATKPRKKKEAKP